MSDDGGVLGNLPRSRPGQRSEKRRDRSAATAATRAEQSGSRAAAPAPQAAPDHQARPAGQAKPAGQGKPPGGAAAAGGGGPRSAARPSPEHPGATAKERGDDPVGEAIRTVTDIATIGPRVAVGVAREVFRRIPRP